MENKIKLEEYDLVSFMMKVQQAILDGYELTDSSDDAPMCIGHCYHAIMREAIKPFKVVETLVVSSSIDTTKLQEQLKTGGEIEQMLADSLVVAEKADKSEEVHGNLMGTIPITDNHVETIEPPKEPTLDESLPKEEQAALQTKQTTKRGKK